MYFQVESAMEWLLIHGEDPDIDEPLVVPEGVKTATGAEFRPNPVAYRQLVSGNAISRASAYIIPLCLIGG